MSLISDRYVVKGRGKHLGKYLRCVWVRSEGGLRLTWEPKQSRASRFSEMEATEHGRAARPPGRIRKLIAPRSIDVEVLKRFIFEHASKSAPAVDAHWVHGANELSGIDCDEATNYCLEHCQDKVDEILEKHPDAEEKYGLCVDGGWGTEHDSTPRCKTCDVRLIGTLTDYGVDSELEALTTDCAPAFDDPEGWQDLLDASDALDDTHPMWRRIAKVIERAQKEERAAQERAAALAAAEGMAAQRSGFLALLQARQVQKAPEPSFRLWSELKRFIALSLDERDEPTKEIRDLTRRLLKEATIFIDCLGYSWRGDTINTPYGQFFWTVVIQVEQYRLWAPTPFREGLTYGSASCPSGDPKWSHHRDANPYYRGDERHAQWDAGYILGCHEERKGRAQRAS